ncbi:MAG TPA: riboflavin synthase [Jatrophihabitantaceae bacterium]|jgi:riboflavin synthase|nr:riboflavin synthase [Jatrophihabitantaceae bacterium]
MFTGIVEEIGEVVAVEPRGDSVVLRVRAAVVGEDVRHGASIAVNGVCLTVVASDGSGDVTLDFDVMAETLKRSVIGNLRAGDKVNLERAARVDARLDGHVVQGHVDGTGVIVSRTPGDAWEAVRFGLPAELARYVAEKGSIAVDGVSLTVTGVGDDWFEVGLIPETLRATVLGSKQPGEPVNLEVDVLAKYVARLMETAR